MMMFFDIIIIIVDSRTVSRTEFVNNPRISKERKGKERKRRSSAYYFPPLLPPYILYHQDPQRAQTGTPIPRSLPSFALLSSSSRGPGRPLLILLRRPLQMMALPPRTPNPPRALPLRHLAPLRFRGLHRTDHSTAFGGHQVPGHLPRAGRDGF